MGLLEKFLPQTLAGGAVLMKLRKIIHIHSI